MNFDNTEALDAVDRLPAQPAKPPERGIWSTLWAGVKAGGAEAASTAGKVAKAYGAAQAQADESNPL
ncbi:MAG: hypothetical protein ACRCV9_02525, partial [Burkholderiaceae bacterium]